MKIIHILMLMLFAVGMGIGQLLLKFSAQRQSAMIEASLHLRLISLVTDWPFLLGASLYGLLLVYWIWLLTFLPLSKAYPFTFLSLLVASAGSFIFFHEPLTFRFVAGLVILGVGLLVLSTG